MVNCTKYLKEPLIRVSYIFPEVTKIPQNNNIYVQEGIMFTNQLRLKGKHTTKFYIFKWPLTNIRLFDLMLDDALSFLMLLILDPNHTTLLGM